MKKALFYIIQGIAVLSLFASCDKLEEDTFGVESGKEFIVPYCTVENTPVREYAVGHLATKSLINSNSAPESIFCNFLRIDEKDTKRFSSVNYKTDWLSADSYISEGAISTIAGSSGERTIALSPAQPYNSITVDDIPLKSRMVGWYPRTCTLSGNESGQVPVTQGDAFASEIVRGTYGSGNSAKEYVGVKFTGLDGSKDIMVSNVKDGSVKDKFIGSNAFTFKHYLSAVRVYAKAVNSSQDLGVWGEITDVTIVDQPTSCIIALPNDPSDNTDIVEWGDNLGEFPIVKTPIFGKDNVVGNIPAEEYPVSLTGSSLEKYLGYSLIKPNAELKILVNTTSGAYGISIDPADNQYSGIFQPGYIYNLHLNFRTDGTIVVFLENDGKEKFLDLTTGEYYQIPSGDSQAGSGSGGSVNIFEYKYSNCYIVNSNPATITVDDVVRPEFDGFCFDATIVGNGEAGIIANGAQTLYPTNAHILPKSADVLWETSPRLIHQVELLFGYVRFKVARDGDGYKEGNAVIAVYDDDRNILWSWHIWITDTPKDITYVEDETKITIMDRNLGATASKWTNDNSDPLSGAPLETYGLYYQWGRKDPSMGPPSPDYSPINMTTAPYYDYSSQVYNSAEVVRLAAPTLRDAVENPMYMILPTSQTQVYYYNWLHEKVDFLWGYAASTNRVHKTIYDPCPYGYRVPAGELADLFAYARKENVTGSFDITSPYGQVVTVPGEGSSEVKYYFPYTGYKGVDRGLNSLVASWKYVGQKADYQSAVVSNYAADSDYYMHRSRMYLSKETDWSELNVGRYSGHQIEDFTNRKTAAPVRCVQDVDQSSRLMAYLTPDRYTISTGSTEVTFKLHAESIGADLSSAVLSVGYHMNNDGTEGAHQEYNIVSPYNITGSRIWNGTVKFDLAQLKEVDNNGEPTSTIVDLTKTTGSFRFVLTVTNEKNINRISSTTITLATNQVTFEEWDALDQDDTNNDVYIGEPILRRFRIYGDSEPYKVEMYSSGNDMIDITGNLSRSSSSVYAYDFTCSTAGLAFMTNGAQTVYFKVYFKSGVTITTAVKNFDVKGIDLVQVTSLSFDPDKYYVISYNNDGYAFDNGNAMAISKPVTYSHFFNIIQNNSGYRFYNVQTGHYVSFTSNWTSSTLSIYASSSNNASNFTLTKTNNNKFSIKNNRWYWSVDGTNVNAIIGNNDNSMSDWNIYEVQPAD